MKGDDAQAEAWRRSRPVVPGHWRGTAEKSQWSVKEESRGEGCLTQTGKEEETQQRRGAGVETEPARITSSVRKMETVQVVGVDAKLSFESVETPACHGLGRRDGEKSRFFQRIHVGEEEEAETRAEQTPGSHTERAQSSQGHNALGRCEQREAPQDRSQGPGWEWGQGREMQRSSPRRGSCPRSAYGQASWVP